MVQAGYLVDGQLLAEMVLREAEIPCGAAGGILNEPGLAGQGARVVGKQVAPDLPIPHGPDRQVLGGLFVQVA